MIQVYFSRDGVYSVVSVLLISLLGMAMLCSDSAASSDPIAIPTFNCLGIYWSPADGSADRACQVNYRAVGSDGWHEALPLWFDAHDGQYRGSIVNLKAGAAYEIQLGLDGTDITQTFTSATWSEDFPIARTVHLSDGVSAETLDIPEDASGSAEGYVLYTYPPGVARRLTFRASMTTASPSEDRISSYVG